MSEPTEAPPCLVCGDLAMLLVTGEMITGDSGNFAGCPLHVDTAIARLQDEIHTVMETKQGILSDWYLEHHPELQQPEVEHHDTDEADAGPVEMQPTSDVAPLGMSERGTEPGDMVITSTSTEQQADAIEDGD